jgi:hypothetical protein
VDFNYDDTSGEVRDQRAEHEVSKRPSCAAKSSGPIRPAVFGIDERPVRFSAITEAIGKQEVDDFIPPIRG